MEDKFEMSDLGLLAYYLGIEVTQTGGVITITRTYYINKILKETCMMENNDTKIPMDPGTKLVKAEDGNSVDIYERPEGSPPEGQHQVQIIKEVVEDMEEPSPKTKVAMEKICKGSKQEWVEDPTNQKTIFARNINKTHAIESLQKAKIKCRAQQEELESDVTREEIKRAVWDCGVNKSPGPDGFTFGFYRQFWDLVEKDVISAVNYFFKHGSFLDEATVKIKEENVN
nr:zinc finger, CCHC-type [Tanacetum cinerariifolium]